MTITCPCGAAARPGSRFCGYDCEPDHQTSYASAADYEANDARRVQPDLRLVWSWPWSGMTLSVLEYHHDGQIVPGLMFRLDDGYRFAGLKAPGKRTDGLTVDQLHEMALSRANKLKVELDAYTEADACDCPDCRTPLDLPDPDHFVIPGQGELDLPRRWEDVGVLTRMIESVATEELRLAAPDHPVALHIRNQLVVYVPPGTVATDNLIYRWVPGTPGAWAVVDGLSEPPQIVTLAPPVTARRLGEARRGVLERVERYRQESTARRRALSIGSADVACR